MQSFLEETAQEIKSKYGSFENLVLVLPSKRAGSFLKNILTETTEKTFFAPEIYSIEQFIEKISGLAYASGTQQLFILYQAYLNQKPVPQDNFHSFSKWGQTLLQDFNEIDRYLIDAGKLFDNLSAIQEVEHWSLQAEKTQMMRDYLRFWNNLGSLYEDFNQSLLEQSLGHQGLVYRKACERLDGYLSEGSEQTFIFMGFNALNTAESQLVQQILANAPSEIYWDIDSYFLDDPVHDAGYFIRQHLKDWEYLKENGLRGKSTNYLSKKDIRIIGVPKNVSQAKYSAQVLEEIRSRNPQELKNTAVVLGDETLLNPLLNSVPQTIANVNITMGYPLHSTPLASFFEQFMALYIQRNEQGWFYRDFLTFLAHPSVHTLLKDSVSEIVESIKKKNWTYILTEKLTDIAKTDKESISLLFSATTPKPKAFVQLMLKVILRLKTKLRGADDTMALEYLYRFYGLFNQLEGLLTKYDFITDLKSLRSLYRQLLTSETLDFRGEPLEGLQIMGMLESRNLDFKTVVITSVNEGILPSGKSNNSFIPFDLKTYFGLPTYKEKDAVYTYHFYRLLQRAEQVYILYSTEPDDVLGGGERSRLLDQLLTDENRRGDIVEINASPAIAPTPRTMETVAKNDALIELIKTHAAKGFSPSSLSNYIRNPIDFYRQNLLGIGDVVEVEETVAANTFGTIVHDTLEDLYRPFLGGYLTKEHMASAKRRVRELIKHHFSNSYSTEAILSGKNLIALHVVERYIETFINLEIEGLEKRPVKLLGLEEKYDIELELPEIDFPIRLQGKLDRVDEVDGVLRIIDYKTGKVENKNVEIVGFEELITDYASSKAFQLLCYALMHRHKNPAPMLEAGIFSFKNLSSGLMRFATKPSSRSRTKEYSINQETLSHFTTELNRLILEICNPEIPFTEKEV